MADAKEIAKAYAVKWVKWFVGSSVVMTGTMLALGEDPSEIVAETETIAWLTDWFVLVESVMRAILGM